jgi:hypothetical protein
MTRRFVVIVAMVASGLLGAVATAQVRNSSEGRRRLIPGDARFQAKSSPGSPESLANPALQEALARGPVDRGVSIAPMTGAPDDVLPRQRAIGQAIVEHGIVPPERLRHFAWCDEQGLKVVGWYGRITSDEEFPGGAIVSIQLSPHLRSPRGNVPFTKDYFVETYEVTEDRVRFLGAVDPPDARPGIAFID